MDIQIPGIDKEKIYEQYEDDIDLYAKVARSFISVTPPALDKLRLLENQMIEHQNVPAQTLADYAVCIHSMKGISATIGAEETRLAALNLEKKAKAGDLSGVLAENPKFLKQADKLLDDMRTWLEQFDAKK